MTAERGCCHITVSSEDITEGCFAGQAASSRDFPPIFLRFPGASMATHVHSNILEFSSVSSAARRRPRYTVMFFPLPSPAFLSTATFPGTFPLRRSVSRRFDLLFLPRDPDSALLKRHVAKEMKLKERTGYVRSRNVFDLGRCFEKLLSSLKTFIWR